MKVADGAIPHDLQLGLLDDGGTEQLQGLIDEVASEIVGDARALLDGRGVLPAVAVRTGPALEGRLEAVHGAERTFRDQSFDGQEVAVPAPVLEDREHAVGILGRGDQLLRVADGGNEGLVDDNRCTRIQCRQALLEVGVRRRGEDDEIQIPGASQQLVGSRDDLGPRMLGGGLSGTIRVRRGDELESEGRVRGDERSVEHATGEAEPDDPGADGGSGGGHPLSLVS